MTDEDLLSQFESQSLSFEYWTHRAHVRVAYLYLRDHPFDVALAKIRQGIRAYNKAQAVPEGPMQGYNETTTCALVHVIAAVAYAYSQSHPVTTSDEFYDKHPQLHTKHVLRLFYSPDRRMHPDAKTTFVPPDLAPLPKHP